MITEKPFARTAPQLSRLGIGPGAHLKVLPVPGEEPSKRPRRSVRGALAGTGEPPGLSAFDEASRVVAEDVEARYAPNGRWASPSS